MARPEPKNLLLVAPLGLLLVTWIGVQYSSRFFDVQVAWIPSFLIYYMSMGLMVFAARRFIGVDVLGLSLELEPLPARSRLATGVIVPPLLALPVCILYIAEVPLLFLVYCLLFALVNAVTEEAFWRGLLFFRPGNRTFTMLFSAALFTGAHYMLWGRYLEAKGWFLYPVLGATFVMGLLWMWFVQKERNLAYPMISHFLVNVLNLSVAVFYGLVPA
ncbi:MAG: CPBP family intramembrane metalloprotease [Acidobacteria bacterium]|nr:CPBP family intramembrane metalloprotease [Acidobacteriota bacterium]